MLLIKPSHLPACTLPVTNDQNVARFLANVACAQNSVALPPYTTGTVSGTSDVRRYSVNQLFGTTTQSGSVLNEVHSEHASVRGLNGNVNSYTGAYGPVETGVHPNYIPSYMATYSTAVWPQIQSRRHSTIPVHHDLSGTRRTDVQQSIDLITPQPSSYNSTSVLMHSVSSYRESLISDSFSVSLPDHAIQTVTQPLIPSHYRRPSNTASSVHLLAPPGLTLKKPPKPEFPKKELGSSDCLATVAYAMFFNRESLRIAGPFHFSFSQDIKFDENYNCLLKFCKSVISIFEFTPQIVYSAVHYILAYVKVYEPTFADMFALVVACLGTANKVLDDHPFNNSTLASYCTVKLQHLTDIERTLLATLDYKVTISAINYEIWVKQVDACVDHINEYNKPTTGITNSTTLADLVLGNTVVREFNHRRSIGGTNYAVQQLSGPSMFGNFTQEVKSDGEDVISKVQREAREKNKARRKSFGVSTYNSAMGIEYGDPIHEDIIARMRREAREARERQEREQRELRANRAESEFADYFHYNLHRGTTNYNTDGLWMQRNSTVDTRIHKLDSGFSNSLNDNLNDNWVPSGLTDAWEPAESDLVRSTDAKLSGSRRSESPWPTFMDKGGTPKWSCSNEIEIEKLHDWDGGRNTFTRSNSAQRLSVQWADQQDMPQRNDRMNERSKSQPPTNRMKERNDHVGIWNQPFLISSPRLITDNRNEKIDIIAQVQQQARLAKRGHAGQGFTAPMKGVYRGF